ncbi:putative lipoprotein [Leptospira yanagawae serovar Saopaulo str. Sao Paulo = ATCC 700523]|uniref:Putative lipoprotein n=1 Tax=Leptospira yanagawae serovar Saopaulo str. Sao Paulo = ATCC 700523 TaxID=1249483 RepID=A0A5E8H8F1_9LEPT|nr:hypothetical protein [Leptospira yanagawae]EOQ87751.1 putative lipoprotein [Leptospira yanagawae serovar Saopaulo str. Sao Paulo = ATCC 700523]
MVRWFSIGIILLFGNLFISCGLPQSESRPELQTKGYVLTSQFPIQEIAVRGKVMKNNEKNLYHLEFDPKALQLINRHKPSKIQLKLPYVNAQTLVVNLKYQNDSFTSNFLFPEGWIDSSQLEAVFYTKQTSGYKIPLSSIYSPFGENHSVYRIVDGKANRLEVEVLGIKENQAVVVGDLKLGDILILSRLGELVDGMFVKVNL